MMPVLGHLDELRSALLRPLLFFAVLTAVFLVFSKETVNFLKFPAAGKLQTFIYTDPVEIVMVYFKSSLFLAFLASLPLLAVELYRYVSPAFGKEAKGFLLTALLSSFVLFFAGSAFSFFVLMPLVLGFLLSVAGGTAQALISINSYISLVIVMTVFGGIVFELPSAAAFATYLGVIDPSVMRRKRKEAVFSLAIASAVITPTTDMFSMLAFLLPMVILYEISILVSSFISKRRTKIDPEGIYGQEKLI